jgi:hypothetical protein
MTDESSEVRRCGWRSEHLVRGHEAGCQREAFPGADYCIFHTPGRSPEDVERLKAAIREQVDGGDFNFVGYCFPPNWNLFAERELDAPNFREAQFEGNVAFRRALFRPRPEGGVSANFSFARFEGDAGFRGATFTGDVRFVGARFARRAWFWDARFGGRADFFRARFEGEASFASVWFNGEASFREAVFFDLSAWQRAVFSAHADFTDLAGLPGSRFVVAVPRADGKEEPQATRFAQAATGSAISRLAKETARRSGDYRKAGEYSYHEQLYADLARLPWPYFAWRRLRHRLGRWQLPEPPAGPEGEPLATGEQLAKAWLHAPSPRRRSWLVTLRGVLGLLFGWSLFGYGERPLRVLSWSVGIILLLSLVYWQGGLLRDSATQAPVTSWLESLYFSAAAFSTLGFGDLEPVRTRACGMVLTVLQSLSGLFMMALFVVSVARRFTRG